MPHPTHPRSASSLCLLLAAALLPGGCVAAQMQLDPLLAANAPEQPVAGVALAQFRKPVTFAGYTAILTRSGFNTSTRTKLGPYERETSSKPFEFTMSGGTPSSWAGDCSYDTKKQRVLYPISDEVGFVCTLIPEGAGGWQLMLASQGNLYGPNSLSGALTDGKTSYGVAMVHRLAGSSFTSRSPVGYEIRDASGAAVAAVQIFNPHKVWFDPKLAPEQQTAIAAGMVALLVSAGTAKDINDQR